MQTHVNFAFLPSTKIPHAYFQSKNNHLKSSSVWYEKDKHVSHLISDSVNEEDLLRRALLLCTDFFLNLSLDNVLKSIAFVSVKWYGFINETTFTFNLEICRVLDNVPLDFIFSGDFEDFWEVVESDDSWRRKLSRRRTDEGDDCSERDLAFVSSWSVTATEVKTFVLHTDDDASFLLLVDPPPKVLNLTACLLSWGSEGVFPAPAEGGSEGVFPTTAEGGSEGVFPTPAEGG